MCLTPIKIVNPTRRFVKGLSRVHLYVGCGHCKECLKRKEDDMFVRAYFEYKRCIESGGEVWFPTLTYNDDHLPWYVDDEHNFKCVIVDTKYLKKFRDHFRMNLARAGYPIDNIRFEFATEYGTEKGRLHHHCLIFMPYKVTQRVMIDCLERAWAYRLDPVKEEHVISKGPRKGQTVLRYVRTKDGRIVKQKVPKYGFIMWSNEWPKTLQNCKAIQYVQKYIHKPSEWLDEYHIPEYEQALKDEISYWESYVPSGGSLSTSEREKHLNWLQEKGIFFRYQALCEKYGLTCYRASDNYIRYYINTSVNPKIDGVFIRARLDAAVAKLKEWRSRCRFHLQSTYFGFNGIDECYPDVDSLKDGRINLRDHNSDNFEFGGNFLYNMPQYYFRHIFLEKEQRAPDDVLYHKNSVYDDVTRARFADSQKRQVDALQPYFQSVSYLSAHLPHLTQDQVSSIFSMIRDLMNGRSVEQLVLYQTCFQGLCCPDDPKWCDYWYSHPLDYLLEQAHTELYVDPHPLRFRDKTRAHCQDNDTEWGDLVPFLDFDTVLDIIMDCEYGLGEKVNAAWKAEVKQQQELARFLPKKRKNMSNNKFFTYVKK